jgi:hypothetical protein
VVELARGAGTPGGNDLAARRMKKAGLEGPALGW